MGRTQNRIALEEPEIGPLHKPTTSPTRKVVKDTSTIGTTSQSPEPVTFSSHRSNNRCDSSTISKVTAYLSRMSHVYCCFVAPDGTHVHYKIPVPKKSAQPRADKVEYDLETSLYAFGCSKPYKEDANPSICCKKRGVRSRRREIKVDTVHMQPFSRLCRYSICPDTTCSDDEERLLRPKLCQTLYSTRSTKEKLRVEGRQSSLEDV